MSNPRLAQVTQVRILQFIERRSHLYAPRVIAQPSIVEVVVVTQTLAFFQISSRNVRGAFGRDYVRIVYDLILQLTPFDMEPAFVRLLAERRLFEDLIDLRAFRNLRLRRRRAWIWLQTLVGRDLGGRQVYRAEQDREYDQVLFHSRISM